MKRKEIFEKLKKDIEPKVDYNYKKTTKGVSIMKRTNEATEKQMLKELLSGFGQLVNRFDKLESEVKVIALDLKETKIKNNLI